MHAFDLNEILDAIAVYLPAPSLRSCILVCHQWNAVFHPHLWRSVHINLRATQIVTTLPNLTLNASHVQDLSLVDFDQTDDYFSLSFPRLQSLYLSFIQVADDRKLVDAGLRLWQRHIASVQSLTLINSKRFVVDDVWGFFKGPPSEPFCALRSLTMKLAIFPLNELNDEARAILCQLDTLALENVNLADTRTDHPFGQVSSPRWRLLSDDSDDNDSTVRIQHLSLRHCYSIADAFHLMMACRQEIRSLIWHNYSRAVNYVAVIVRHLRDENGMWANLEELELNLSYLEDQDLAGIIGALKCPLKKLSMTMTSFGNLSARTLLEATGPRGERMHCERLKVVFVCGCVYLSGSMVQRFLCECPNLKDFRARLLSDLDVQRDPRPWVCKNLHTFLVGFAEAVTEGPAVIPSVFIERLSALDRLEVLGIMDTGLDVPSATGVFMEHGVEVHELRFLKIDLQKGLDRLWRLKRLNTFRMDFSDTEVFSVQEARWMAKHWPRLERVMLAKVQPLEQDLIRVVFSNLQCVFHL